jgi:putative PIN family toxin of toxin-antitoxin system
MIPKTRTRIVLDTNVCLDLFVFCDPRWQQLLNAIRQGSVEAVTRADCKMEWSLVLSYERFHLDETAREKIHALFDEHIRMMTPPAPSDGVRLPVCRDPDDQKFIELAHAAQADILISKDKALLKLARKTAKAGLFQIMTPEHWIASCAA